MVRGASGVGQLTYPPHIFVQDFNSKPWLFRRLNDNYHGRRREDVRIRTEVTAGTGLTGLSEGQGRDSKTESEQSEHRAEKKSGHDVTSLV